MSAPIPEASAPGTRPAVRLAFGLLLLLLPFLVFAPSHQGEFTVDDLRFIVQNDQNLSKLDRPWKFFSDPSTNSRQGDDDIYRPLRTLSFAVDRALFGEQPLGYHLHSVALHGLVALLLYVLLSGTLRGRPGAAMLAALLFVVHPLTTESVCWISSRADLQAALLMLLGLILARRAEGRRGILPAVLACAFLSGFAKESAVMLPALYLIEHRLRVGRFSRAVLWPFLMLLLGAAFYLVIYLQVQDRGIAGQVEYYEGSFWSHLPYGLVGVARQLRLALVPVGLNFLWEPGLFHPLPASKVVLACTGLGLTALAVVMCWRRRPAVALGLTWFAVALLPTANLVLPMRSLLAERFAYLPLVGIVWAAAALIVRLPVRSRLLLSVAILLLFSGLTLRRAGEWATQRRLYESTLSNFPDSYPATLGLGGVQLAEGERLLADGRKVLARPHLEAARHSFERALLLSAHDPVQNLDAACALGRTLLLLDDLEGSVKVLARVDLALQRQPELAGRVRRAADARFELGVALSRLKLLDAARRVFSRLIEVHGKTPERLDALGEVYRAEQDGRAIDLFLEALDLDPDYHPARIHLALIYMELPGFRVEGIRQLGEVLLRDPGHSRARELLEKARNDPGNDLERSDSSRYR